MLDGEAVLIAEAIDADAEAVGMGDAAASRGSSKVPSSESENLIVFIFGAGIYEIRTNRCGQTFGGYECLDVYNPQPHWLKQERSSRRHSLRTAYPYADTMHTLAHGQAVHESSPRHAGIFSKRCAGNHPIKPGTSVN